MKARLLALLALALAAGCGVPSVSGVAGVSPAPDRPWVPPAALVSHDSIPAAAVPADLEARIHRLTLGDLVTLGLATNPATRAAWAEARAAAATYGAARGAWYPTVDASATATRLKTVASQGRTAVRQNVFNPALNLSWLVFDFGGRAGTADAAREALVAADFTHNAAIQAVILGIQQAYFQYVGTRALRDAQALAVTEADTGLRAAEERQRVGVATIADVLQARTASAQAQLALETLEGEVQTARGALAASLGFPANLPFDLDSTAANVPVGALADSVETLITEALRNRPDLAAARAEYAAARARVAMARADRLPSLDLSGAAGRTYTSSLPGGGNNYTLSLGLRIPLFAGFSRWQAERAAEAQADAAAAQAEGLRSQVIFEVFSAYYTLQAATRRVSTADALLASATESEDAALARYRQGVGTLLELLSAQAALATARAQRVQARLDWNVALAQLARNAGVLDASGASRIRVQSDSASPPASSSSPSR